MRCLLILLAISSCLVVRAIRETTDIVDDGGSGIIHQRSTADKDDAKSNSVLRKLSDDSPNLFPNRTEKPRFFQSHVSASVIQNRLLSFRNDPYPSQLVVCEKCSNLTTCRVLNNLLIQEVYYPKLSAYVTTTTRKTGTCEIIEQRGIRLSLEIFGVDKTFRDTPTCRGNIGGTVFGLVSTRYFLQEILTIAHPPFVPRTHLSIALLLPDIVMQYLCLFWGSDNSMYTNFCIYQEDVSDPNPINHKLSPRQPCRSFCVQVNTNFRFYFSLSLQLPLSLEYVIVRSQRTLSICRECPSMYLFFNLSTFDHDSSKRQFNRLVQVAAVCANDADQFYMQCGEILCPPTQDTCTPGKSLCAHGKDSTQYDSTRCWQAECTRDCHPN